MGYEYGVSLRECRIIDFHFAHLRYRIHMNDLAAIFKGKGAVEYAGNLQSFPGRSFEFQTIFGKGSRRIAARTDKQPCNGCDKKY